MVKTYLIGFLCVWCNVSRAQTDPELDRAFVEQYAVKVDIKPLPFELVTHALIPMEDEYIKYEYTLPMLSKRFCFYRRWDGGVDTVEFLKQRHLVQGDKGYPFNGPAMKLHDNVLFYLIRFKKEKYLLCTSSIMGATGHGASCSTVLLILNLKTPNPAPAMSCAIVCNFDFKHFVDYGFDGKLDLLYYNWKSELIRLKLESNQVLKLK